MNGMFTIGWLIGTAARTLIPYWIEMSKDGRDWDWKYIMPVIWSAIIAALAQIPIVQAQLNISEEGLPAFMAGLTTAVTVQQFAHTAIKR